MGKKDRVDPVRDAQEIANNNINPYYWFNRVNSYTIARMRASLAVNIIEFGLFSVILVVLFIILVVHISSEEGSLGSVLFDHWQTRPEIILIILIFPFWLLELWLSRRWFEFQRQKQLHKTASKPRRPKKKLPKRRKDYGQS